MIKKYMFDGTHDTDHIPDEIRIRERLQELHKVEKYFVEQCNKKNIPVSFDCSAKERVNWNTLNYTSYNGMMWISPLSPYAALNQLIDALSDNLEPVGHIEFIKSNIEKNISSKYILTDKSKKFKLYDEDAPFEATCILPGHNKYNTLCKRKLRTITKHWGSNLVYKVHPITDLEHAKKIGFDDFFNEARIASRTVDMYDLIKRSSHIYSTHVSETALTSLILEKTVEPIDNFDNRLNGGFGPISHFCYTYPDALAKLNKIFASYKSGIVHPTVDNNWKEKINKYLDYLIERREFQNGFYLR